MLRLTNLIIPNVVTLESVKASNVSVKLKLDFRDQSKSWKCPDKRKYYML